MTDAGAMHQRLTDEVESAIARTASLPGAWYADPGIAAFEKVHLFRRCWQPAVAIGGLKQPGDFLTCEVADVPVLIVRQDDGGLKAFRNMCRHRGHPVATGTGNVTRGFVCAYHGWSYRPDGTLLNAVRSDRETAFDPGCHGRLPVRLWVWGEMAFVNLVAEGTSDDDVEQAAQWNYELVHGEDRPVCEAVQKNIMAGSFEEGPVMMGSEDIVQAFQKRYLSHLAGLDL